MVKLLLGETRAKKIQQVSLSNGTIERRILLMSTDVKQQVIAKIRSSPMFVVQLDKSTNVTSCSQSQLLVFVQYIQKEDIKKQLLYCNSLRTTATAQDVMNIIPKFFEIMGKTLWRMYGWSLGNAWMQIWFSNQG